jgi:hypothetical protein
MCGVELLVEEASPAGSTASVSMSERLSRCRRKACDVKQSPVGRVHLYG